LGGGNSPINYLTKKEAKNAHGPSVEERSKGSSRVSGRWAAPAQTEEKKEEGRYGMSLFTKNLRQKKKKNQPTHPQKLS